MFGDDGRPDCGLGRRIIGERGGILNGVGKLEITMRADLARIVKQVLLGIEAACACAIKACLTTWGITVLNDQVIGSAA